VECGLIGDGELVRSHGQAAPLIQPVDASLDRVALPIRVRREAQCAVTDAGRAGLLNSTKEFSSAVKGSAL
jgi:hypothetical protein